MKEEKKTKEYYKEIATELYIAGFINNREWSYSLIRIEYKFDELTKIKN